MSVPQHRARCTITHEFSFHSKQPFLLHYLPARFIPIVSPRPVNVPYRRSNPFHFPSTIHTSLPPLMGVVAELGRLAIGAWSPGGAGGGYIASGSFAGSTDPSFGNGASLEIISVDTQRSKLVPLSDVPAPDKFCSIDWAIPSRAYPAGLIAGGLADGTVRVWDAASLIRTIQGKKDESTAVIFGGSADTKRHSGPVRGLAFNPFFPTRLASGSADGQVLVWDLAKPSAGASARPPAGQSTASNMGPKEEVSAISWNRKVQHILGSATSSGTMNVWDLKQSKRVISIRNPRGRLRCSSLAWHPDIPTQIVICCEEDESTGAVLWDLRNATAPILSYSHHGMKGVVSSHWCPHDSDLLLTSSRDSRTAVVSVSSGEIVSEAPQTANWNFDVKWSPRVPGLYLASSFDGRITVNSLMTTTTASSVSSETANALAESFGEMAGGFQSGVADQSPRSVEAQRVTYSYSRPPKWLKRPVSLSFGFGGWRASVVSKEENLVSIESYQENFPGLKDGINELDNMLMQLTSDDPSSAQNWCEEAGGEAETPREKMAWDALSIMFQTDCRRKLLQYLGFELPPLDAGDDIAMPVYGVAHSQPLAVPVRPVPPGASDVLENRVDSASAVDSLANGAGVMNLDGPAPWEVSDAVDDSANAKDSILDGDDTTNGTDESQLNKPNGVTTEQVNMTKSFAGKSRNELDVFIKKSVIVGDFRSAVDACVHVGRPADALIIAYAGGPDLWAQTQAEYLSQATVSSCLSVVGAIAGPKSKMDSYIREAAESVEGSWKEALAVLLTYGSVEDIAESCTALGQRLLLNEDHAAALFCFICAGNTRMATTIWMRDRPSTAKATSVMRAHRIERLTHLVQKVRLINTASALCNGEREIGAVRALDEVSGSVLCEYGALLAAQGDVSLAVTYLSNLDPSYACVYGSAELIQTQASESLAMTDSSNGAVLGASNYEAPTQNLYRATYNDPYSASPAYGVLPPQQPIGAPPDMAAALSMPAPPASVSVSAPPPYGDNSGISYTANMPPLPTAPATTLPRPGNVFSSTASTAARSVYDPSTAYAAAPTYDHNTYQPPPTPGPAPTSNPVVAPVNQYHSSMPAPPTPPVPVAPMSVGEGRLVAPLPGSGYGGEVQPPALMDPYGMQSQMFSPPPPPPPPPPMDDSVPPPMPYHTKAKPGSGASLPPSAEVAVDKTRQSRVLSTSGTPGGPPRRSGSTSSSLSALGMETVLLDKADMSKIPSNQQVIVKSLRGAYSYALNRNRSPIYKKKMDDVSKRLGRLVAGLNAGLVEGAVVELLVEIGMAIEKGNYDQASVVVTTLTKQYWESNSQWIQGLKRLIDCVLTGR